MRNRRKGRKIYTYRVKNRRMFSKYHPMRSALGMTALLVLIAVFGVVGYSVIGPLLARVPQEKEHPTKTPDPYVFTTAPPVSTVLQGTQTQTFTEATEPVVTQPLEVALYLADNTVSDLAKLSEAVQGAASSGYQTVVIPLRLEGGALQYHSEIEQANACLASKEEAPTLAEIQDIIRGSNLKSVARIETISDSLYPTIEKNSGYLVSETGELWLDDAAEAGGKAWMSPASEASQQYLSAIVNEIAQNGFTSILCGGMHYPKFFQSDLEAIGASVTASDERQKNLTKMLNVLGDTSPLTAYEFDLKDAVTESEEGLVSDDLHFKKAIVRINIHDFEDPFFYGTERYDISKLAYKDKTLLLTQIATELSAPMEVIPCIERGSLSDSQIDSILNELHAAGFNFIYIDA